jgi:hypothetical protein
VPIEVPEPQPLAYHFSVEPFPPPPLAARLIVPEDPKLIDEGVAEMVVGGPREAAMPLIVPFEVLVK